MGSQFHNVRDEKCDANYEALRELVRGNKTFFYPLFFSQSITMADANLSRAVFFVVGR